MIEPERHAASLVDEGTPMPFNRRPCCELCRQPAAWLAIADGRAAPLCDDHRHAAAAELEPLVASDPHAPEQLGEIVLRYLELRRRRRVTRPFRADL